MSPELPFQQIALSNPCSMVPAKYPTVYPSHELHDLNQQMTYGNKECSFSEYMKELRDTVREDSKKKVRQEKISNTMDGE